VAVVDVEAAVAVQIAHHVLAYEVALESPDLVASELVQRGSHLESSRSVAGSIRSYRVAGRTSSFGCGLDQ